MKYHNPFYNPKYKRSSEVLECDIIPKNYLGFDIYERIKNEEYDVVYNHTCIGMYAGLNGAKNFIDMIIRETKIIECWCPKCGHGQVKKLLEKTFADNNHLSSLVGSVFDCDKCGAKNKVEDFVSIIPSEFYVISSNEIGKSNDDVRKFIDSK